MKESRPPAAAANGSSSGSNAGLVAALRLGWAATLMAVQEDLEQQELSSLMQQPVQGGTPAQRDDYSSTAAVLQRARQTMAMLEDMS